MQHAQKHHVFTNKIHSQAQQSTPPHTHMEAPKMSNFIRNTDSKLTAQDFEPLQTTLINFMKYPTTKRVVSIIREAIPDIREAQAYTLATWR